MITGDVNSVANSVASSIGIDEVYSEVLPTEKVKILENKVKDAKKKTIFVGGGINDAPVLAVAELVFLWVQLEVMQLLKRVT